MQARVYLALAKLGDATIKTIATISKVARQDIYRILSELQNLGLVEKLVDTPTKFRAIPIKECVFILLQNKSKEMAELQQEAGELILDFSKNRGKDELIEEESQFVIINELQARRLKSKKAMEKVQKTIRIVTKGTIFTPLIFALSEEIFKAVNRGVKIQLVVGKPEGETALPEPIQALKGNPLFEIRYDRSIPSSALAIYDDKEVILTISASSRPPEAPILWSNNPSLVELAQNYFKIMWNAACKENNIETPRKTTKKSIQ